MCQAYMDNGSLTKLGSLRLPSSLSSSKTLSSTTRELPRFGGEKEFPLSAGHQAISLRGRGLGGWRVKEAERDATSRALVSLPNTKAKRQVREAVPV